MILGMKDSRLTPAFAPGEGVLVLDGVTRTDATGRGWTLFRDSVPRLCAFCGDWCNRGWHNATVGAVCADHIRLEARLDDAAATGAASPGPPDGAGLLAADRGHGGWTIQRLAEPDLVEDGAHVVTLTPTGVVCSCGWTWTVDPETLRHILILPEAPAVDLEVGHEI